MTLRSSSLERTVGRLEGQLDRLEALFDRLERHDAIFEKRLSRVERTQDQWRAWAALVLGAISFVGSVLPYVMHIVF